MLKRAFIIACVLLAVVSVGVVIFAQIDDDSTDTFGYFIAPDANDIDQIWSFSLEDGPQKLTTQTEDIASFGVSVDGDALAYNTADALWYQPLDGEPFALTAVSLDLEGGGMTVPFTAPAISPDGTQIVYRDSGLYTIDVIGGEPRLLVPNITDMQNIDDWRFVLGADFLNDDQLLADVGIWESRVPAIVDLNSGEITEAPRYEMSGVRVISEGRLVLYHNSFIGIRPGLDRATAETINTPETIADGTFGIDGQFEQNFVYDLAELENGDLRVIIEWLDPDTASGQIPVHRALIDYDITTGTGSYVIEAGADTAFSSLNRPSLSADGLFVVGYAEFDNQTGTYSGLQIYDIAADTLLDLPDLPTDITEFVFAE